MKLIKVNQQYIQQFKSEDPKITPKLPSPSSKQINQNFLFQ